MSAGALLFSAVLMALAGGMAAYFIRTGLEARRDGHPAPAAASFVLALIGALALLGALAALEHG